jgi:hypothetical protein
MFSPPSSGKKNKLRKKPKQEQEEIDVWGPSVGLQQTTRRYVPADKTLHVTLSLLYRNM